MAVNKAFWQGRRVLVTGHTGFKGSWMSLWLERLGAQVWGLSLPPYTEPNHFDLLGLERRMQHRVGDIRDRALVRDVVAEAAPEVIFHMAAQPIVALGWRDPQGTFATNVMGTIHVLEAALECPSLRAALVITSDKVYANPNDGVAFTEDSPLGGEDPYSASKAATEMAVRAFHAPFAARGLGLASARAGNVIGGGDWSAHRIVTDLARAAAAGTVPVLRRPNSVRPWQHVLEPLSGYLRFAARLVEKPDGAPAALNFGPPPEDCRTVAELAEAFAARYPYSPAWQDGGESIGLEAGLLTIASDAAHRELGWSPRLDFKATIDWTAEWYAAHNAGADMPALSLAQLERFGLEP
ncbi:CDP-glucose 4,6-dehydratase [Azospirillum rugosum]|uniref:CDP-glucose 4,6-dehydratase n=1 Tax=Azospirillum rugosum TaxID=416170 RepID=A0ABS4SNY1_9PROT|nr:CDP-glucose 4,6-dehydratase [Azospirillum rugosum]MBP2294260.1 CDP-glucose 4,6-dehydratase [Azospirillum rugosum]MDQ0527595.1 CDP-glucose 4,6-dehydratase [Azospirillum rugosum]